MKKMQHTSKVSADNRGIHNVGQKRNDAGYQALEMRAHVIQVLRHYPGG